MACINIRDSLAKDPRFKNLQKLVGRQTAFGVWYEAAEVAQEFWKRDRSLMPKKIFAALENSQALVDVGLVEEKEHGFYLLGSHDEFDWLIERKEAASRGGKAKAAKRIPVINELAPSKSCQTLPKPALLLSLSLKEEERREPTAVPAEPELPPLAKLWNAEIKNLPRVTRTSPHRTRKANSIHRQLPDSDWLQVFRKIDESKFCNGANDRGWKATFDWILQPDAYLKVLDGKYDNWKSAKTNDIITD